MEVLFDAIVLRHQIFRDACPAPLMAAPPRVSAPVLSSRVAATLCDTKSKMAKMGRFMAMFEVNFRLLYESTNMVTLLNILQPHPEDTLHLRLHRARSVVLTAPESV